MTAQESRQIIVRSATERDIPGLVECAAALFAEDAGSHDPAVNTNWPHEYGSGRFSTGVSDPGRLILVAVDRGDNVVGYLTGTINEPTAMTTITTATLTAMWVRPELRGRGTGGELVQQFLTWAREQRAERAEVTAYTANEGARSFYARHGFISHSVTAVNPLNGAD